MKKVPKTVYCSRCGDEIAVEELPLAAGTTCALCSNMQLEAQQILHEKRKQRRPELSLVYSLSIKPR